MTVKELMEITGKSRDTIVDRVKKTCPDVVFKPKTKTVLNEDQTHKVLESFIPQYQLKEYLSDSSEKTVRVIHERVGIGAMTDLLKQMGKYLSKDEMHDFIVNNKAILAPEPLRIENPKEAEENGA